MQSSVMMIPEGYLPPGLAGRLLLMLIILAYFYGIPLTLIFTIAVLAIVAILAIACSYGTRPLSP